MRTNTTIAVLLLTLWALVAAYADDHDQKAKDQDHDYIIERQQDYMVQGPPTDRIINGSRELDGYRQPDGSTVWFDRSHVEGVTPPR